MANKLRWANIICDEQMRPNLLIVTDGEWDTHVPISNSNLSLVKRTAHVIFDVPLKHILVTQLMSDEPTTGK